MLKFIGITVISLVLSLFSIASEAAAYQGSGFFIDHNGDIATAGHMVEGKNAQWLVMYEGRVYKAKLIAKSDKSDVAIIHIDVNNTSSLNLKPFTGKDTVYIIGFPYTSHDKLVVTSGVSGIDGHQITITSPQINACGGNSGGPIADKDGNGIGVLVAGFDIAGTHCSFLSVAEPISDVIDLAKNHGIVVIGDLGNLAQVNNSVVEIFEVTDDNKSLKFHR